MNKKYIIVNKKSFNKNNQYSYIQILRVGLTKTLINVLINVLIWWIKFPAIIIDSWPISSLRNEVLERLTFNFLCSNTSLRRSFIYLSYKFYFLNFSFFLCYILHIHSANNWSNILLWFQFNRSNINRHIFIC